MRSSGTSRKTRFTIQSTAAIEKKYPPTTEARNQSGRPKNRAVLPAVSKSAPQKKTVVATAAASVAAASREQR